MKGKITTQAFGVQATHFSLYEAFRKEAEGMGWRYNSEFQKFSQLTVSNCLFFSFEFGAHPGEPAFALSTTDSPMFLLETQFGEALEYAKRFLKSRRFELNENLTAYIDIDARAVSVLGAEFSFNRLRELVDRIDLMELEAMIKY